MTSGANGAGARNVQQAIERAKLEWESTADALAALVCLLGRNGEITRSNRVIEDWSLATVSGAVGQNAHTVLHPDCSNSRCALRRFFALALRNIRRGSRQEFEFKKQIGERFVQFTIRPMRHRANGARTSNDPRAVLVANDLSALYEARDALNELTSDLEQRVMTRTLALSKSNIELRSQIARRKEAEIKLRNSRNELMALSEQLIGAQEAERQRIAVELHDSIGQSLSAVKYTLERGIALLAQPHLGDPAAIFELAVRRIQESTESIRSISMNLRPKILDDLGAASAVQWFCREFAETYPNIAVTTEVKVVDRAVPDHLATVVFRCTQELLNNVAKHASAEQVSIRLAMEAGALSLLVRDDGIGIRVKDIQGGQNRSGLSNLRERAQMSGGQFMISAPQEGGTLAVMMWKVPSAVGSQRLPGLTKRSKLLTPGSRPLYK